MESDSISDECKKILTELEKNAEMEFADISKLLSDFRILTREKTLSSEVLNQHCVNLLVNLSKVNHIEAQKCLSNLILNYSSLRDSIIDPYVDCVETRLTRILGSQNDSASTISIERKQLCEVLYHDLRIIFLLSALCSTARPKIQDKLVNSILEMTERESNDVSEVNFLLIIESLKTLFNLTLDKCINQPLAGQVINKLFALVGTEISFEKSQGDTEHSPDDQLLVNLIHLLTNMPEGVYLKLSSTDVDKILAHLYNQLKAYAKIPSRDTILPILNVCANICKYNESIRQRWFEEIISSTKEFEKRPEEYDSLRGRLVKLMTSVDLHIKDIAAEFLYALCGGDTEKFITYTGFGNSAAFLSSRGLLGHNTSNSRSQVESCDDKDYQDLRGKLDLMTGKFETAKKNPMEGMSEEEKEHHAIELADAINKLSNLGVVKPMSVDEDGTLSEFRPDRESRKRS